MIEIINTCWTAPIPIHIARKDGIDNTIPPDKFPHMESSLGGREKCACLIFPRPKM